MFRFDVCKTTSVWSFAHRKLGSCSAGVYPAFILTSRSIKLWKLWLTSGLPNCCQLGEHWEFQVQLLDKSLSVELLMSHSGSRRQNESVIDRIISQSSVFCWVRDYQRRLFCWCADNMYKWPLVAVVLCCWLAISYSNPGIGLHKTLSLGIHYFWRPMHFSAYCSLLRDQFRPSLCPSVWNIRNTAKTARDKPIITMESP